MAIRGVIFAALAAVLALAPTVRAGEDPLAVDLALVLAVDASGSVDENEAGTQRAGYIYALRDKRVVDAIKGAPIGRLAITYIEWSSPYHQTVVIPWRVLESEEDAKKMADDLENLPYTPGSTTSISGALDFSVKLFKDIKYEAARKVIDVSGDGYSDYGRPVTEARDEAVAAGITINGLAVMTQRKGNKLLAPEDLDVYYRENVIGGPGSFYIAVRAMDDFSRSVLQKMVLEISALQPEDIGLTSLPKL
jgi:hypothetical protein